MSEFYTHVSVRGNNILYRGVKDGKRIKERIPFSPTLFLPTKTKSKYKTLHGDYVEPIQPGSIKDCRDFINKYEGIDGFTIYGNTDYTYQYIGSHFPGEISYHMDDILVAHLDIETECENGFPNPDNPIEKINAITVKVNGHYHVFGVGVFNVDSDDTTSYQFDNEIDMLVAFLELWDQESPDVITGWNVRFFDIPYLHNRILNIMGEKYSNKLSPWRVVKSRSVFKMNHEQTVIDLVGVSILDYLELYRVFTYTNQESYKLDHIAFVELGERKMSYDEYGDMASFYKQNFQKFIEYNKRDVTLIVKMEEKLKLLELACALAYSAKVNLMDVFSQVRTWDQIIYHHLNEKNIVIPFKKISKKDHQYTGAYVKDPITGFHDWVVSYDLTSLYPMLIIQGNISPETKIHGIEKNPFFTVDGILNREKLHMKTIEHKKSLGYAVAANDTCYTKKYQGFLPELMEKMYKDRKKYKQLMIDAQKKKELDPTNKQLDFEIAKYKNFQLVRKIQLNSAYGAIGSNYFRYYDIDLAEAITTSGQLSIRWIANNLNEFLNKTLGTENYDYVVASDTDSVYLRLGNLVDKVCKSKSTESIVDFLDKASSQIIVPFIDKKYDELAKMMNAYQNKMNMDREVIADKGIWTAKKRYILNVHDSEGVRYASPKLKIMGIETTRSSTPQIVRDKLKEAIKIIVSEDENRLIEFIEEFRQEFNQSPIEDIAFPRGVSKMDEYHDRVSIYKKSTPIAVKGALIYNHYLKKMGIDRKYENIREGDKIKFVYLKVPNAFGGPTGRDHVISFANTPPKEFELEKYMDYNKQFEKSFLDPLRTIVDAIGWSFERKASLEDFFG